MTANKNDLRKQNIVSILGVKISNLSIGRAISLIESLINTKSGHTRVIYIVNAHTLNLAIDVAGYRDTLNSAFMVFGDGTGVRWAARQGGVKMKDNLVGTDLIPQLFEATAGSGYRYFLLGADNKTIKRAADACIKLFPGWELVGYHHGYVQDSEALNVVQKINHTEANLLLVGMGNPKQEQWIYKFRHELNTQVAIGVGGLFDHWGGNLTRAPRWVRQLGFEWLQILLQQPRKKWYRYLIGNPKFLWRIIYCRRADMSKQN